MTMALLPDAKVICVRETRENEAELILGNFAGWSPEHPHLYGGSIEAGEDRIESYFGMRKFGCQNTTSLYDEIAAPSRAAISYLGSIRLAT